MNVYAKINHQLSELDQLNMQSSHIIAYLVQNSYSIQLLQLRKDTVPTGEILVVKTV